MQISQAEYIAQYLSDKMFVPTVMFWIAIAIAATSVVCFILAPIYSKGKHGGVKVLAQIISIIDFIGGIGSILVFVAVSGLSLLTAAGAFADASLSVRENLLGILLTPSRFGMSLDSFISGDLSVGTIILFYGLYFGVAGLLGIIAFIVSSSARGKYNGINGKIRGAAVPQGMPQYNPYQPYGQYQQNIPQGYPQQYQQNVPQGYPQQYSQNMPQGYPQQYQQNAPQGYPQQYQQNAQYQSTSGETQVLTSQMPAQPVAAVPVMNAQPVPGYAEPVPEPSEPTAPGVVQPEASAEPVPEVAQSEAPTESAPEIEQSEAPKEPATEVAQSEVPTEPAIEVEQSAMPAQQAPASFCVNCGKALAQGGTFCPNCGYRVNTVPTAFCTGCGAKLPDGAMFCTACGKKRDM